MNVRGGLSMELAPVGAAGAGPHDSPPAPTPRRGWLHGEDQRRLGQGAPCIVLCLYPDTVMRRAWPRGRLRGWRPERPALLGQLLSSASQLRARLAERPSAASRWARAGLPLHRGHSAAPGTACAPVGLAREPQSHQLSPDPCVPTPLVAEIGPEGRARSAPPRARVDASGLEQHTPPAPHP